MLPAGFSGEQYIFFLEQTVQNKTKPSECGFYWVRLTVNGRATDWTVIHITEHGVNYIIGEEEPIEDHEVHDWGDNIPMPKPKVDWCTTSSKDGLSWLE